MRTALTIAGSDSGAGAGIQADLKTFAAHGVYGTSAITAVTAQNTRGVASFEEVSPQLIRAQIEAVMSDLGADAAKTGMLASAAAVEAVAQAISDFDIPFVVVDPVMLAKSGDGLADAAGAGAREHPPRAPGSALERRGSGWGESARVATGQPCRADARFLSARGDVHARDR